MHKESFLVSSSSLNLDSESSRDLKIFHGEDSQLHSNKTVCFAFDGLVRSDHANIKNNKLWRFLVKVWTDIQPEPLFLDCGCVISGCTVKPLSERYTVALVMTGSSLACQEKQQEGSPVKFQVLSRNAQFVMFMTSWKQKWRSTFLTNFFVCWFLFIIGLIISSLFRQWNRFREIYDCITCSTMDSMQGIGNIRMMMIKTSQ